MKKQMILILLASFIIQPLGAVVTKVINQSKDAIQVQGYGVGCAGIVLGRGLMCGTSAVGIAPGGNDDITYRTKQFGTRGGIRVKVPASGAMYDVKSPDTTFKEMSNPVYFPRQFKMIKKPMPKVINDSKETITVLGKGVGCVKVKKGITLVCGEYKIAPGKSAYINENGTIYAYDKQDNRFEVKGKLDGKVFRFPKNFKAGGVAVKNNKADKAITVVAKRVGCLGTSKGEVTTCRTKTVAPGKTSVLDIKYPYSSGFELIAFYGSDRYKTVKTFADGQTATFPGDFRPAIKGAYATIEIRNKSKQSATFVSRRIGCAGTSKGMLTTCKTETVPAGKSGLMGIKYPYSSGYELVAFQGKDKYVCDRKLNNYDPVEFPKEFTVVNRLQKVDPNMRYDQVCYLCSHNSYSSATYGFAYSQQFLSLTQQLNKGTRVLMLDTHLDDACEVKLCHNSCGLTKVLKPGSKPRSLKDALIEVKKWLDRNKTEVITINLEDYMYKYKDQAACKKEVTKQDLYMELENKVIESVPGLTNMILTKKDWDPNSAANKGKWPTLKWLQQKNKRLIIFTSDGSDPGQKYMYPIWKYTIESGYSSLDGKKICAKQRSSSLSAKKTAPYPRQLYLLNYFPEISLGVKRTFDPNYNSYDRIWSVIELCDKNKVNEGKWPNQIAVDFVDKNNQDLMHVINRVNKIQMQNFKEMQKKK